MNRPCQAKHAFKLKAYVNAAAKTFQNRKKKALGIRVIVAICVKSKAWPNQEQKHGESLSSCHCILLQIEESHS